MTFYYQQIAKIARELYPHGYLSNQLVQAKQFIDTHYTNDINLAKIASEAYFSKFHFTRLFKKLYGTAPNQYLTSKRVIKAKQLLRSGQSVTEACNAVGFTSISSFNRLFKRYTGSSPSFFINKSRQL